MPCPPDDLGYETAKELLTFVKKRLKLVYVSNGDPTVELCSLLKNISRQQFAFVMKDRQLEQWWNNHCKKDFLRGGIFNLKSGW